MKTVSIIGVGLIGGSLGLALKSTNKYRVIGVGRNPEKLKIAKHIGAIDDFTTEWYNAVKDADIIVICTPVDIIAPTIEKILPHLKPYSVITDVGSVKYKIVKEVKDVLKKHKSKNYFVGAHPLAGSEKMGIVSAQSNLYKGAYVVLTKDKSIPKEKFLQVESIWTDSGADVLYMDADLHDKIVAATSHLPHILAYSLCSLVGDILKKNKKTKNLLAGSFKDLTRIADSNPKDWAAICKYNSNELTKTIDDFIVLLKTVRRDISSSNKLENHFTKGKISRGNLL